MSGHTPTPWNISESGLTTNEGQVAIMAADAELGRIRIGLVDRQTECKRKDAWQAPDPIREANAAFIVRACNAHEALVGALSSILDCVDGNYREVADQCRAALALARGEQVTP